jgi:hypothetical protein
MAAMSVAELDGLIGRELPAGTYRIDENTSIMLRHAVYAGPDSRPHPIYAFIGGQGGLGISVAQLLEIFGTSAAEGPLLGECRLEFPGDLEAGCTYQVTGRILDAKRKSGRLLGIFDLITFQADLTDAGGKVVASCRETFVVPRGAAPANPGSGEIM